MVQSVRYEKKGEKSALAEFLVSRAIKNFKIANNLNWYFKVESEDPKYGDMYTNLHHNMWISLKKSGSILFIDILARQQKFVDKLYELSTLIKSMNVKRERRIQKLRKILQSKQAPWDWPGLSFLEINFCRYFEWKNFRENSTFSTCTSHLLR